MTAIFLSPGSYSSSIHIRFASFRRAFAALVWMLPVACGVAAAQTTTISGTVYDPRGATGLPLPNVLVYASTTSVTPPPSGVQCLTYQAPTGSNVVAYAYTAVDGTFTLLNVPENATYTIVIQAGKWLRQFSETVVAAPLTGLVLSMPANHTEGNIPFIAIVTGSVDGVECVLRDMGIADTEFTDDNQTVNSGGYIHLYKGDGSAGAEISSSTPAESTLTGSSTLMGMYDMAMFACQGSEYQQASASLTNILGFVNAGGRLFTTHYSYVYLDPSTPPANWTLNGVANWDLNRESLPTGQDYPATVQTNFSDGATLAQWLQTSGATIGGASNQIDIGTVRVDVDSVNQPTQPWVTLNGGAYTGQSGNPVMQMTFNTPVGSPAAGQCGRVMFNDYHVYNVSDHDAIFPTECPNPATHVMSAQEEMLEYALFDLSTFVQPVVVPTLNVTFNPNPLVVKSGDTADQLTVDVTNTSTTTEIESSAILTFTLPPDVTVTAMTDSTGGWICTASTATCTRNSSLAASATDPVTLTLSVADYTTLASYTGTITATVSSVSFSTNPSFTGNVIYQQTPVISWATPASIVYGTALGAAQLDATSTVAGTYAYSPAAGTVLAVGQQTLSVTFTPNDTVDYTTATATVTLTVVPATPSITLSTSANPVFMTYAVSFTASLPSYASTQTGTMTFYDGSTQIGSATLSGGSATITTTVLPAGSKSITAVYSGDANYGPGTSNAVTENIQDFTLTFAGGASSATVPAAGKAVYTLVVTPVGGATLPATVTLSAAGIPLGATAVFSSATVAANSSTTDVTLQIALPGSVATERPRGPFGGGPLPVALGILLLPIAGRLRKARARLARLAVLLLMGAALAAGFTGCGGAKLSSQNFSFTVTAASGSLSHSVTPGLTVQ